MKTEKQKEKLSQIARHLILNGSFLNNLGLLNGKMGIIIFFYHYAKFTGCSVYRKFADELMEELYEEISRNTPMDFGNGLCGIAWGIMYIIQNGFVKVDEDVLGDIDEKIMERDVTKMKDFSVETGLAGIGYYAMSRLSVKDGECLLPAYYMKNIMSSLKNSQDETCLDIYGEYKERGKDIPAAMRDRLISLLPQEKALKQIKNLGISNNGYAGVGLNLILKDDGKN